MDITTSEISSIDFDISIDSNCYAQTTIMRASPRCKVYYCFKNDDTREDGEDRCTQDTFTEICDIFIEYLGKPATDNNSPAIKCNINLITNNGKHSFGENDISADTLKKFINLLSEKIDEFAFLVAFKYHI